MVAREREFGTRAIATEKKANGAKRASRSGLVGEFVSRKVSPGNFGNAFSKTLNCRRFPRLFLLVKRGSDPHLVSNSHLDLDPTTSIVQRRRKS